MDCDYIYIYTRIEISKVLDASRSYIYKYPYMMKCYDPINDFCRQQTVVANYSWITKHTVITECPPLPPADWSRNATNVLYYIRVYAYILIPVSKYTYYLCIYMHFVYGVFDASSKTRAARTENRFNFVAATAIRPQEFLGARVRIYALWALNSSEGFGRCECETCSRVGNRFARFRPRDFWLSCLLFCTEIVRMCLCVCVCFGLVWFVFHSSLHSIYVCECDAMVMEQK